MIDLQILIDSRSVVHYIAKYGTKVEKNSKGLGAILDAVRPRLADGGQQGDESVKTIIRRAFIGHGTGYERCMQNVHHLLNKTPIVRCDQQFLYVRLNGMNT